VLYAVLLTIALGWWFTAFDPSRITNARLFVMSFWVLVVVHLCMMALVLGLFVYFMIAVRGESVTDAEKASWVIVLLVFNLLAYPFFYFLFIRPRLRRASES
jgi:hypothetical protein